MILNENRPRNLSEEHDDDRWTQYRPVGWLDEQLRRASPDLLRGMIKTIAEAFTGSEADAICGAPYGERSDERTNKRNGYRDRTWDTRAGSIELTSPKLRSGHGRWMPARTRSSPRTRWC